MELSPEKWNEVKALFEAALDKTPAERSSFLHQASEDESVLQEVERLLAHHTDDDLPTSPLRVPAAATVQARAQTFSSGEILAGRFRVVRFLARGGMGEVYEALDLELQEHVALKTIRPELLSQTRARERFKREVHLAKKVTHPNVCRIFDLFRHPGVSSGTPESVDNASVELVSMELLNGKTLAERLQQVERLTTAEALPIALQMATGLGAAHELGILHRDFKPGNIVLVPSAKGTRAVITDFGLAFRAGGDSSISGMLTTSDNFGTPAYMSPEQVEGAPLTPASDVYALGLVFYQMVTGKRPFEDPTPLSMAVRRLKETPPSPRSLVPELDPVWEKVILRCLEREPKRRFVNADEVGKALRGEIAIRLPARPPERKLWLIAGALLIAALVVVLLVRGFYHRPIESPPISQSANTNPRLRRSVAVLGFRNLSGSPQATWISTAVAEMLSTELGAGEDLRVVPAEQVARAKLDLGLVGDDTLAVGTLQRLRHTLASDFIVLGSYLDLGQAPEGRLRLDLRLQDASSGETLASFSEKGSDDQLDDLISRAGANLREKLAVGAITVEQAAAAKASAPSAVETARLYAEGLDKLRQFDVIAAGVLLERAIAAEPDYALAHSAFATTLHNLGDYKKSVEEAKKAFDLSAKLPYRDRLLIEGRYREANSEWDRAIEIYTELSAKYPDELDYGIRLISALEGASKLKEAMAEVDRLHKVPPPVGDDPRIDLEEAYESENMGDFQREQTAAARAAEKATARGTRVLMARAEEQECWGYVKLGKTKQALPHCDEAERAFGVAGDRNGVAIVLNSMGGILNKQGDLSNARQRYQEALSVFREVGNKMGTSSVLNNLASIAYTQGDLKGATSRFEEALAIQRELGNKTNEAKILSNMGDVLKEQGDLGHARKIYLEGAQLFREIHDVDDCGLDLMGVAQITYLQGNPAEAKKILMSEALPMVRDSGDKTNIAFITYVLGDVLAAQGDVAEAQDHYQQAMAAANEAGEKGNTAQYKVSYARLLIDQRKAGEALEPLQQAIKEFEAENETGARITAEGVLARALLTLGKGVDAQQAIDRGAVLLSKNQSAGTRLGFAVDSARVLAATGHTEQAMSKLRQTTTEATQRGFVNIALEASLASAETQMKSGQVDTGRARLKALEQDAKRKGFLLIATKAASAAST